MHYKTTYELTAKDETSAIKLAEDLNEYLMNTFNKGREFKQPATTDQIKHLCSCYQINYVPEIVSSIAFKIKRDKTTLQRLYIINLKDGVMFILVTRVVNGITISLKHVYSVDPYFKKTKTFNNTKSCIRDFLNIKTAIVNPEERPFIIKSIKIDTDYELGLIDFVEL